MFNNNDDETDFCESYKSQILGSKSNEKENSLFSTIVKLLTILILLTVIIGVSFYGYNYIIKNTKLDNSILPPVSMQTFDDELVVEIEEPVEELVLEEPIVDKKEKNETISLPITAQIEELDIDKIAKSVQIAIAKSELEENNSKENQETFEDFQLKKETNITTKEESLEIPTSAPEAKYLEDLANLSKEIDKERNK